MDSIDYINICFQLIYPFILSIIFARLVIALKILDVPNQRSSHSAPVPRCGGIAIVMAMLIGIASYSLIKGSKPLFYQDLLIGIVAVLFAVIGLIDDLRSLGPVLRFVLQVYGAGLAILTSTSLSLNHLDLSWVNLGDIQLGVVGIFISILWVVGYTNYVNFMDGLNGMVGGNTIIHAIFIALITYSVGLNTLAQFAVLLASATAGFLIYNFPRGRLFMGDVGSYYIGYIMAIMPLVAQNKVSIWLFLIIYFNFLFDATFTLCRRLFMRQNVLSAHRSHLFQLLQRSGWAHTSVSVLYWAISICQGCIALCVQHSINQQIRMLALLTVIGTLFAWYIVKTAVQKNVSLS